MLGESNPGYKHGGKFSPWSKNSEHHNEEQIAEAKRKAVDNRLPEGHNTRLVFYTSRGMTEEEAMVARGNRQRTFSLETCIAKHGEKLGKQIHAERQAKWHKSFKKSNFSKISQKLFWQIVPYCDINDVYFAQLSPEKTKDESGTNHEYTIQLEISSCKPDFFVHSARKVIEFDGDYWHGREGNQERTRLRDISLIGCGYDVLHVAEKDFNSGPSRIIAECVSFLKDSDE